MHHLYQHWTGSATSIKSLDRLIRRLDNVVSVQVDDSASCIKATALSSIADAWNIPVELMSNYDAAYDTICDMLTHRRVTYTTLEVRFVVTTRESRPDFRDVIDCFDQLFFDAIEELNRGRDQEGHPLYTLLLIEIAPSRDTLRCVREQ
jgi:hypothetical protein